MTLFLLDYFTLKQLPFFFLSCAIIFLTMATLIAKWRESHSMCKESIAKDFLLFQKHLDSYYVTNIWYTSFMVTLYGIMLSGIFLLFRLSLMGYERYIDIIDTSYLPSTILPWLIFTMISFMICIICYRTFLQIIFFKEVIKLYFYMSQFYWFQTCYHWITLLDIVNIFFQWRAVFEYLVNPQVENQYGYFRSFEILEDEDNWTRATFWRNRVQHNILFLLIAQVCYYFLSNYESFFYKISRIPQIIFSLVLVTELFNRKLFYIYYLLPIVLLLKLISQCYIFFKERKDDYDTAIYIYFYKNDIPYEKIRLYFKQKNDIYDPNNYQTLQSIRLTYKYNMLTFKKYVLDRFIVSMDEVPKYTAAETKNKTLREQIMIIMLFVIYNYSTTETMLLYIILIIMFYFSQKALVYIEKKDYITSNKTYTRIFWIFTVLELFMIYILIVKAKFIFMDNNILWDYIITIRHTYSDIEKIQYFWHYIAYITKNVGIYYDHEYLQSILSTVNLKDKILSAEELKDIKVLAMEYVSALKFREQREIILLREILLEEFFLKEYLLDNNISLFMKYSFYLIEPYIDHREKEYFIYLIHNTYFKDLMSNALTFEEVLQKATDFVHVFIITNIQSINLINQLIVEILDIVPPTTLDELLYAIAIMALMAIVHEKKILHFLAHSMVMKIIKLLPKGPLPIEET